MRLVLNDFRQSVLDSKANRVFGVVSEVFDQFVVVGLGSLVEILCEFVNKITNKGNAGLSVEVGCFRVPLRVQSHSQDLVLLNLNFVHVALGTVIKYLTRVSHYRTHDGTVDCNFIVR